MSTAYVYARFSSDNQREESIDAQLRAIRAYCEREGITILREFPDEAVSARTDKRPRFQEMFETIGDAPADFVIVHKLDRFARNRYDAAFYRSKLKKAGMRLISVLEPLDDSPESIIMEGLLESMSEYYSANLAREVRKGMDENIINGKRLGGKAPMGYRVDKQHLFPNEQADRVRDMFRDYANGKTMKQIAAEMGKRGTTIHDLLRNEVYIGTLVSGPRRHENAHEPLIDMDTWNAVQRRLDALQLNAAGKAKREYLCSGRLVCGLCGCRIVVACGGKPNLKYYHCGTKGHPYYRTDKMDKEMLDYMAEVLKPTDGLRDAVFEIVSRNTGTPAELEEVKKTNSNIDRRVSTMYDALSEAINSEERKEIMQRIRDLKASKLPLPKTVSVTREQVDAFVDKFFDLKKLTPEEQKGRVRRALDKAVIYPDYIDVYLYDMPHPGLRFRIRRGPGSPEPHAVILCT